LNNTVSFVLKYFDLPFRSPKSLPENPAIRPFLSFIGNIIRPLNRSNTSPPAFLKDQTFYNHCLLLMTNRSIGVRDLLKIIYDLCMEKRKMNNQLLSYVEMFGVLKD